MSPLCVFTKYQLNKKIFGRRLVESTSLSLPSRPAVQKKICSQTPLTLFVQGTWAKSSFVCSSVVLEESVHEVSRSRLHVLYLTTQIITGATKQGGGTTRRTPPPPVVSRHLTFYRRTIFEVIPRTDKGRCTKTPRPQSYERREKGPECRAEKIGARIGRELFSSGPGSSGRLRPILCAFSQKCRE